MEQHPNGGGLRGSLVSCSATAYLDNKTEIHDNCSIWGAPRLKRCNFSGNCRISGDAYIIDTVADGFVTAHDHVQVQDCRIETMIGSEINLFDNAILRHCEIRTPQHSRVEIGGYATLDDVTIVSGSVHIEGGAIVRNCELEADTWLHRGVWLQPPMMEHTSRWTISECTDGYIHVQCQCHAIDQWQRYGLQLAKHFGLDADEVADCEAATMRLLHRLQQRQQ